MDALVAALDGFAPALASALVHSLWQVAILAVAAALALRAMARASAASRHNVAMTFLLAMVLVPAAQFLAFWHEPGALIDDGFLQAIVQPLLSAATNVFGQDLPRMAAVVVLFWLSGVGWILVRHIGALRAIGAMERTPYQLLPANWRRRVDELRGALGIARVVAVRLCEDVFTPCSARLLRPVIWLPLSLLTRAPVEQIEALLAHELAHIARKDWLWNGMQCVVESLLFYHPAVWWLGRRIRREREHACDDLAVAACGNPIALAEALAALERERHVSPRLVLGAGGGSLVQRIARLLSSPPRRGRWRALAVLGAAVTLSAALLIALIGIGGGHPPDLQVRSSTEGDLGPGDYREITANGPDKQRFYLASIDAQGRLTETYREDGRVRPIDADVRRWVVEVTQPSVNVE
jgi:beta-lactamase regulating signal transducer with metallopeptidase domain